MNNKYKKLIVKIIAILVMILLDQWTKYLAVIYLKDQPLGSHFLIPNVLQLYYLTNGNTGAAFGMLKGHTLLFIFVAIIIVTLIGYILIHMPEGKKYNFLSVLLTCIAAGGLGNLIDRIRLNYVIDFIYFSLIDFPIFNVADMYVSVSTVILAFMLIFRISNDEYTELENAMKAPFTKKKSHE